MRCRPGWTTLPATLEAAWALDWSAALRPLTRAEHLYVVGRGAGLAVAQEAALKLKETCGLHAEAFSAAEIRHGPMALVGAGFPVLAFVPSDESREGVEDIVTDLRAEGASVLAVGGADKDMLPMVDCPPLLLPLAQAQSFYRMVDGAGGVARIRSRRATPPRQGHGDHMSHLALVGGRVMTERGPAGRPGGGDRRRPDRRARLPRRRCRRMYRTAISKAGCCCPASSTRR